MAKIFFLCLDKQNYKLPVSNLLNMFSNSFNSPMLNSLNSVLAAANCLLVGAFKIKFDKRGQLTKKNIKNIKFKFWKSLFFVFIYLYQLNCSLRLCHFRRAIFQKDNDLTFIAIEIGFTNVSSDRRMMS